MLDIEACNSISLDGFNRTDVKGMRLIGIKVTW